MPKSSRLSATPRPASASAVATAWAGSLVSTRSSISSSSASGGSLCRARPSRDQVSEPVVEQVAAGDVERDLDAHPGLPPQRRLASAGSMTNAVTSRIR